MTTIIIAVALVIALLASFTNRLIRIAAGVKRASQQNKANSMYRTGTVDAD